MDHFVITNCESAEVSQMKNNLEIILDSTHDAIVAIDAQCNITFFNESAKKLMHLEGHDLTGQSLKNVIPNSRLPYVLKSQKAEINQTQILGDITIITNRMPIIDKDHVVKGAVAVFRDMTEVQELAEKITELKEVKTLLEAIIDTTQDAISVVDENGIHIMVNHAYTALSGLKKENIVGKSCTEDISEGESIHLKVLQTRKPVTNSRIKLAPKNKDIIVNAAPLIVNGELKGSVAVIHDVTEIKRLTQELNTAKQIIRKISAQYAFEDIIGNDKQMVLAITNAKKAAITPATVLLRGESGTGKELFAHAIHNESNRRYKNLVRVNCAAIPEQLLESELFGYDEGAFTGAKKGGKKGLFEQADEGTIFLDEIGKMSLTTQSKLLRVLQEKEILRVGGTDTIKVDVRVIAATNQDLEHQVREGTFREDLYYRLNVIPIFIPPLRHRKNDIPLLIHHIINKYNNEYGRFVNDISPEAIDAIQQMKWKGNVRELENFIGRIMINMESHDELIEEKHLPVPSHTLTPSIDAVKLKAHQQPDMKLDDIMALAEKEYILKVLKENQDNKTKTAQILGISIRSLYYKLEKYHQ